MNKKPLTALSVLGAVALLLSAGSIGNVMAQDQTPISPAQSARASVEPFLPQSPQQPEAPTGTQLGSTLSYQGQLQKGGGAYNGTCNFQFSLWDAATGGVQKGTTNTKSAVNVANGLFSVELNFGGEFVGDARWLQTAVQCTGDAAYTTLTPRQPQNAVPYAQGLKPGSYVFGTDPSAIFTVQNNTGGAGLAGYSSGNQDNSWGVFGHSNNNFGVVGDSANGFAGVYGNAPNGYGVYGISHKGDRAGVYGYNDTTEPYASGVSGVAPNGNGVFGGSDNFSGGYFYSKNGIGVVAASDNHDGIQGTSHAAGRSGVYGANDNPNGFAGFFLGKTWTKVVEIAGGSDLAERFSQAEGRVAEPGTVMVIDPNNPGQIKPSAGAYDRKVAGIVSGAGDIRPGLTLHQEGVMEGNTVMAIAGRVYVKAEAISGPIAPGDLLTTSDLPGYAMKASDDSRSHGAVLGKAMTGLESGMGLVLVIVNLQ